MSTAKTKDVIEAENKELTAQNEALKAELEAMKATKADEPTTAAVPAQEEKVEIFVPKGYANDEPNLLIGVNGVNYVLPKGKASKVPKHIAAEFYRSQKAQMKLDEHIDQMLEASK